jgi:plastocyanin
VKRALVLLVCLVTALGLVACGDDDDENGSGDTTAATTTEGGGAGGGGGGGGGETLTVTADESGNLAWEPTELNAPAGPVTLELDNPASVPHNIEVEGNGVSEVTDTITQGTTSVTVDLKPGEYEFYCNVPGHQEAGMDGTLTVK